MAASYYINGEDGYKEPTYELGPSEKEKFNRKAVEDIVSNLFEEKLKGVVYDDEKAKALTLMISNEVKGRIKEELQYPRYKIVVQTVIGQVKDQGAYVTSRCLWDHEKDNYASQWFQNVSFFLIRIIPIFTMAGTCILFV